MFQKKTPYQKEWEKFVKNPYLEKGKKEYEN